MKTRDRILETARDMFNARRFGNVTTSELAAECGISEGNLWYHYKSKRSLLEAIAERFLSDVEDRLTRLPSDPNRILEQYADMLSVLMSEIRQYRFLYRDQADYGEHTDNLLHRLPGIYRDTQAQFQAFLHGMIKSGHLHLSTQDAPALATNSVIILRYHLEFLRESGQDSDIGSGAVRSAIKQHLTLFEDALTDDAHRTLLSALDMALDTADV